MATNTVSIDVVANDLASAALDLVKNKLLGIGGTAGMVGVAAVTMGAAIVTGLSKAKDAAQTYDQQIKELMLRTGGTAEETSRLRQTLDDAGIGYETLSTAMRFAVKNGIEPNIESIARLSTEYLALNGPVERGQFLLDKFGRSGMDMARIMDLGGEAILRMSDEVEKNLIVTDEAIRSSEQYRVNVDNLKDSFDGLKVKIGNEVIPVLNNFFKAMENGQRNASARQEAWNQLRAEGMVFFDEEAVELRAAKILHDEWANSVDGTTTALKENAVAAQESSNNNIALMSTVKTIQAATDSYEASLSTLTTETGMLERQQAAMGTRTAANAAEWDALSQKIWENNLATSQLARDNEMAMKKIAADLYIAKLSADGLTDAEYKLAIQALITSGQIDQATADMAMNFEQNLKPEIIKTKDEVRTLGNLAKALATDYFMNFVANLSVNYSGSGGGGASPAPYSSVEDNSDSAYIAPFEDYVAGPNQNNAQGSRGWQTVPPGYPGDSYIVGMSSGESYNVKQHGNGGGGMVINLTYAPAFSMADRNEVQSKLMPFILQGIRDARLG